MRVLEANVYADIASLSREEWVELRKHGIGGSDASAIAGLSQWASPLSVYFDKIGEAPLKEDTEAMRQGRDLEEYVAQRFREATGKQVKKCGYMLQHPEYQFMLANIDRLVVGEKAGLECKTTSVYNKSDFPNGEYPLEYYVQCQHYMAVTGALRWYLAVLVLNSGFYVFEIERSEEDIAALIALEKDFWLRVQSKNPPQPDGSSSAGEIIKRLYANANIGEAIDLWAYKQNISEIIRIKADIKALENELDKHTQIIQDYMKNATEGLIEGYTVTWRPVSRKDLDKARLREQYPDAFSACLATTSFRKFSIKEIKQKGDK